MEEKGGGGGERRGDGEGKEPHPDHREALAQSAMKNETIKH